MLAAAWLTSPAGKRFAVQLAILGYPLVQAFAYRYAPPALTSTLPFEAGLQVDVVMLLAALVVRVRRARRGAGDGEGTGAG